MIEFKFAEHLPSTYFGYSRYRPKSIFTHYPTIEFNPFFQSDLTDCNFNKQVKIQEINLYSEEQQPLLISLEALTSSGYARGDILIGGERRGVYRYTAEGLVFELEGVLDIKLTDNIRLPFLKISTQGRCEIKGNIKSSQTQLEVKECALDGKISTKKLHLDAQRLKLTENASLVVYGTEEPSTITLLHSIDLAPKAECNLLNANVQSRRLSSKGILKAASSNFSCKEVYLYGDNVFSDQTKMTARRLLLKDNAKCLLVNSEIDLSLEANGAMSTTKASSLILENSLIQSSGSFEAKGKLGLINAMVKSPQIYCSHDVACHQSILDAEKILSLSAKVIVENKSWLKSKLCLITGEVSLNEQSLIVADKLDIKRKLNCDNSFLSECKIIHIEAEAALICNKSQVHIDDMLMNDGSCDINETYLECERLSNHALLKIDKSKVKVKSLLRSDSGKLVVSGTPLESKGLTELMVDYQISDSTLNIKFLLDSAKGNLLNSSLKTKLLVNQENAHSTSDHSFLQVAQYEQYGHSSFVNASELVTESYQQHGNVLSIKQKSKLTSKRFFSNEAALTEIDSDAGLYSQNACFEGTLSMEQGQLHTESLQLNSKATISHSFVSSKKMACFGRLLFDESKVTSEDIDVFGIVIARKSLIHADNDINLAVTSVTKLDETRVQAKNFKSNNILLADQSLIDTSDSIELSHTADTTLCKSKLETKGYFKQSMGGSISGTSANIIADSLYNSGDFVLTDGLKFEVNRFYNHLGSIDGGTACEVKADHAFLNFLGSISATKTQISSPVSLNIAGDIVGHNQFESQSLFHLNAGSMRSTNASVNSIFNLNFGLMLQSMPSDSSVFTSRQHWTSLGRTISSNFLPAWMNSAINFGFSAYQLGSTLQQFYPGAPNEGEQEPKKKDIHDYMKAVVSLVNVGTSGYKLGKEVSGFSIPTFAKGFDNFSSSSVFNAGKEFSKNSYTSFKSGFDNFSFSSAFNAGKEFSKDPFTSFKSGFDSFKNSSAYNAGKDFSKATYTSFKSGCDNLSYSSVADACASTFGPSYSENALFTYNAGRISSGNVTKYSMFSLNHGQELGWQAYSNNSAWMSNKGNYASKNLSLAGFYYAMEGSLGVGSSANIHFNEVQFASDAHITGQSAKVYVKAEKGKFDTHVDTAAYVVNTDQFNSYSDFFQHQGAYSNIHTSELTGLTVNHDLLFDFSMNTNYGLQAAGNNVNITADQRSSQQLSFEATVGDLHADAHLTTEGHIFIG